MIGEDKKVIGTCSLCGGPVTTYKYLLMVGPWPPPSCEKCGATMREPYGRVIPMVPKPQTMFQSKWLEDQIRAWGGKRPPYPHAYRGHA